MGCSILPDVAWTRQAVASHRGHQCGVNCQLCPVEQRKSISNHLKPATVLPALWHQIRVKDQDVGAHPGSCLAALSGTRSPDDPTSQPPHELHGGGQGRVGDGHTGSCEKMEEGEARDDEGTGPCVESNRANALVGIQVKGPSMGRLDIATVPAPWLSKRCALTASVAALLPSVAWHANPLVLRVKNHRTQTFSQTCQ